MTLETILRRFAYLEDEKCFYDKYGRKTHDEDYMVRRLMDLQSWEKAVQTVGLMKSQGTTRDKLKVKKPSLIDMVRLVYEKIKPSIRLRRVRSKGENGLYSVAPNNEVTFMGIAGPDKFSVLVASDHELLREVNAAHESFPELYSKMDLMNLVKKLFDLFIMDPEMEFKIEPQLISWDPSVPAYKILDPSIIQPGPHPSWDSFTARLSHPEIFKAYLWSIFDPKNDGRQALWIRGEGMDGKSSVVNAISTFLGRDHVFSIGQDSIDQRWFFSSTYGKRLGIYMDCMNMQVLRKEKIKSILGGDTVEIDDKNEKIFSAKVRSKLIILSNFPAHINYNDKSEVTRLLFLTAKSYTSKTGDPNFEPSLVAELPHFLHTCREIYPTLCPTGSQILVPQSMQDSIQSSCASLDADLIEEFIAETLSFGENYFITRMELAKQLKDYFRDKSNMGQAGFSFENMIRILASRGIRECRIDKDNFKYKAFKGIGMRKSPNIIDLKKDVVYDSI